MKKASESAEVSSIKARIEQKIADITAHETLDQARKSHAIDTLKELSPALSAQDADHAAIIKAKLAELDGQLSAIAAKEAEIKAENIEREADHRKLIAIPRPALTLAQRHFTHDALLSVVNS